MKIGHFGPTFIFPGKTVNFFGVKHVAPSSTLKMRKSHKKSARVYAYTHAYTQLRDGGGRSAPPLGLIGLIYIIFIMVIFLVKNSTRFVPVYFSLEEHDK